MPFDIATDVSIHYFGFCFGQRVILTTNYSKLSPGTPEMDETAEINAMIDEVIPGGAAGVVTAYLACLGSEYTMTQIRGQALHPNRYAYIPRTVTLAGAHADPCTVANDAASVTLRAFLSGRAEVATKHIGPVPDGVSASGLLTAPYKALLNALGSALLQDITLANGAVWEPVIYHRDFPGTASRAVTALIGEQSRVQRRRTVGLGE